MKQQCWRLQKLVLKKVEPCPSSDFIFVFLFIVPTMERVLLRSSCPRSQMVKKIRRICVHWLIIYIVVLHRNWLIHINVLCPDMMNHSLAYCKSAYFCMLQTGDVYCESQRLNRVGLHMPYMSVPFHVDVQIGEFSPEHFIIL